MKRTFSTVLGVMLLFLTVGSLAQKSKKRPATANKTTGEAQTNNEVVYKAYKTPIPVYLDHSDINGGIVPKNTFDSLLKQGLSGKDSSGVVYKVTGFNFTYAERNLYEDSTGTLMVLSDYMIEHCEGDTVSASIASSIYQRTKAGDTVYIDQVNLLRPDGVGAMGKAFRVVIAK